MGHGLVFFKTAKSTTIALDESAGELVWSYPRRRVEVTPIALVDSGLLVALGDGGRGQEILDVRTGTTLSRIDQRPAVESVVAGDLLFQGGLSDLRVIDLRTGRKLWAQSFGGDPQNWMTGVFGATEQHVVYGLKGGPVVCHEARTGREVWRQSVADLRWKRSATPEAGEVWGRIALYGDRVIVGVWPDHVVGMSLEDGTRVWTYDGGIEEGHLYGGRYYVFGSPYAILDPITGAVFFRKQLSLPGELAQKNVGLTGPALVSETHLFAATNAGYLAAWDRDTGRPVWHLKPKGAVGAAVGGRSLIGANGRLYYADMSYRIYCLEEQDPSNPKPAKLKAAKTRSTRAKASRKR